MFSGIIKVYIKFSGIIKGYCGQYLPTNITKWKKKYRKYKKNKIIINISRDQINKSKIKRDLV